MSLRVVKRKGTDNLYIRGTVRGLLVNESTGTSERSAAEAIRIQREKELLDQTIFGKKVVATFVQAAVIYMENGGERRFVGPLIDLWGTTALSAIDQMAVDRAAATLYPKAKAATRVRQVYAVVRAIIRHAAERGLCEARIIRSPSVPKGRIRWLKPEEAERLIAACAPHLKPLVMFLFGTGARLSEALYLDWRYVDLGRREVQFVDTKNKECRGVPLHPRLVAALSTLPHREGAVFRRNDGMPYVRRRDYGGQIKTGFRAACRRAGIDKFTPHGCRHTWATWTYAATRNLLALMTLGGWSSPAMAMRYAHLNVEHHAEIIAALPWAAEPEWQDDKVGSCGRASKKDR
ncbi:MAG: site-specific integrase [Alphaproteobacteria bacterium]|nr:site-specific integrase [Alphaproteobacteria bacterium]